MSTTCESPVAMHSAVPSTIHLLQGGGTYLVSAWPLRTLEAHPCICEPLVPVAPPSPAPPMEVTNRAPHINVLSAAARYRRSLARNLEDTLDWWGAAVIGYVVFNLAVVVKTALADLISSSLF